MLTRLIVLTACTAAVFALLALMLDPPGCPDGPSIKIGEMLVAGCP